jgi:hypothetical protein
MKPEPESTYTLSGALTPSVTVHLASSGAGTAAGGAAVSVFSGAAGLHPNTAKTKITQSTRTILGFGNTLSINRFSSRFNA